jgi:hypothetical protein
MGCEHTGNWQLHAVCIIEVQCFQHSVATSSMFDIVLSP